MNGNGVYEAQALLSFFDPPNTVYSDDCSTEDLHRHEKKNAPNSIPASDFNLYPNPNNGGFTLDYQLQKGQTGEFTIYTMLGEKLAEYNLNENSNTMKIIANELSEGVYLYNISVNNNIVKRDKLVIIK